MFEQVFRIAWHTYGPLIRVPSTTDAKRSDTQRNFAPHAFSGLRSPLSYGGFLSECHVNSHARSRSLRNTSARKRTYFLISYCPCMILRYMHLPATSSFTSNCDNEILSSFKYKVRENPSRTPIRSRGFRARVSRVGNNLNKYSPK